jgi:hypothetical protein
VRFRRISLVAGAAFAMLASGLAPKVLSGKVMAPLMAQAQNIGQRAVYGRVINASSVPVAGATVFLKDLKTKSIRSFTTEASGRFRFAQANMAEDQELWAEKDGKKSATKTVSSWDTRQEFEADLKLK